MRMLYGVLADIVVFVHFLWILFLIFGGLVGTRIRTVKIVHIAGLFFALLIQTAGWYCPLTDLEVWLRTRQSPGAAYGGSFIIHYMERIVYLRIPGAVIFSLTVVLCIFNGWLYVIKGGKSRRKNSSHGAP